MAASDDSAVQTAKEVVKATSVHEATGGTLLEGPTFGGDGRLYFVDVMAPAGEAKVLALDLESRNVAEVFTDGASAFTSAQFGHDDRLYLTDIASGSVLSLEADGSDPQTVFTGEVEGSVVLPDDLAFDGDGSMFVTDTRGMQDPGWQAPGRVIRIDSDGVASVLARDLPSPNGISFDEQGDGLWVAQYNANRLDYYALNEDRTAVKEAYPGIYVDAGRARVDSTAVDSDGNIYQAFHGLAQINVYSNDGKLIQIIEVPGENLESATNVAIRPGSTEGYITVSGSAGGYIYSFDALGEGTRQSNGG
ncbi:SMP-30/gluconolactonase/LRE family protein [Microbacterium sp. NPDC090225]|uniref:SMP-30/gluconolactonase/LRE family protein n=1 Tax=Microbacterium sp. NPDC090225 TaxID=3364207 RepID=UPI00380E9758